MQVMLFCQDADEKYLAQKNDTSKYQSSKKLTGQEEDRLSK